MKIKRIAVLTLVSSITTSMLMANAAETGDSLKLGDYTETAVVTQELINNRPNTQRRMETLDRGVVAVRTGSSVFVSWRWLGTESIDVRYNVYRNGEKLNSSPLKSTNYTDLSPTEGAAYSVSAVYKGNESEKSEPVLVWENGYLDIPLQIPTDSYIVEETELNIPYRVSGDATVADLDGDSEYEIVVKWDPCVIRDASKAGYTGECLLDAYELDGTLMWRINMGKNIRSGPHDTQFIVYDFDNDGKAEISCRTADGTVAGDGTVIGDADVNWAELNNGKNLQGPLYLTVFNGTDGSVMDTVEFYPQTTGTNPDGTTWDCSEFGDKNGNRSERYLAALGCFDGEHTGFIQSRGYYGRTFLAAYHIANGKIVMDWTFDSEDYKKPEEEWSSYEYQGNHSMSTADVDYDGYDEVIFGAFALDNDGTPIYNTGLKHGDAQHVGDILPLRPGLEVYSCHESNEAEYGYELRDARTGEILFGEKTNSDNGRACTADITPEYEGEECWSAARVLTSADGTVISTDFSMPANFAIWWDGDLGREIQDGIEISKWNSEKQASEAMFRAEECSSINAAKSNPALTADILGDWREETIYPTADGKSLRVFINTEPTSYRIPTLMHDTQYRNHVALQNVCYNQPTHTSFYLGYDMESVPVPQIYTVENGKEVRNPDLANKSWDIDELYCGQTQELVVGCPVTAVNGEAVNIDENSKVVPYINEQDRTMVPIRFISEAFGAEVSYDDLTKGFTIELNNTKINMTVGVNEYSINEESKTMDTVPVIVNDRTLVPIRAVAESFSKNIEYFNGLIIISDNEISHANPEERINEIKAAQVSDKKQYNGCYGKIEPINIGASANNDNAALVNDGDVTTGWEAQNGDSIIIELEGGPGIPAVSVVYGDTNEHILKLEVSGDGKKWSTQMEKRICMGNGDEYIKLVFGVPPYKGYVRYTCLDENGCSIKEFAVLGVE